MHKTLVRTILIFAFSCSRENEDISIWAKEYSRSVIDTMTRADLGVYVEPLGFFVIEIDTSQIQTARKLTYRKGYPVYIDTLSCIKPNEFRSNKEEAIYLIKDTCVISINYVKIFHPNSNLRGQAPWVQPYVNTYKRLDK